VIKVKKDLILLAIVFIPLMVYNIVNGIKNYRQYKKFKKILKEIGRWKK